MNSITRSTLWMLFIYTLVAIAVFWWMGAELRSAARGLMGDTARLIGHEVSGALLDVSVDNLIKGDRRAQQRLAQAIDTTARASLVLSGLSVVDAKGRVVASDDTKLRETELARPDEIFAGDREPQLFSTFSGPFDTGTFVLLTPVFKDGDLVGYIQMNLNNRVIGRLFETTYWRLLLFGLAGGVAIIGAGMLLHMRFSRYQYQVVSMLDSALEGKRLDDTAGSDEMRRIRAVAERFGVELDSARGQAELRRQDLDTVATLLKVGMLLLGPEGKIEFSNNAAQDMLTGGRPAAFPAQLERLAQQLREAVAALRDSGLSNLIRDVEIDIDGNVRRFRIDLYAMDPQDWRRFLVIIKDRDLIDALESDLRTATRFRGLSTLYVGAAHDLRGPLNNMVVHLELLKQTLNQSGATAADSPAARSRRYIDIIQQEIYRLNRYVQALLDLTAPAQDNRSVLDLGQAIAELIGLVRAQSKLQQVQIDWHAPEGPLPIHCQQVQIRQVLLNIIINGLEAMPNGGRLDLRAYPRDGSAIVEICDTGPGIPEAVRQRIFDMHFTTKDSGTGIGLYVAHSVIQELGGTIEVNSTLGEGSCFVLHLPLRDSSEDDVETQPRQGLPGA